MPQVVAAYHDLWHVEEPFRMAKADLQARPIFHHKEGLDRGPPEAHLTIVFAALAVARHLQRRTDVTIKKLVQMLRPLRSFTITIAGAQVTAHPRLDAQTSELLVRIPDLTGHQNRAPYWNSGQAIHRGSFRSVKDLDAKIRAFITGWNERRHHPFV